MIRTAKSKLFAIATGALVACGAGNAATPNDAGPDPALDGGQGQDGGGLGSEAGADADVADHRDGAAPAKRYDADGPEAFTTFNAALTNGASSFTEIVYVPSSVKPHAVVSLSPGLQQTAAAYAPYAKRLASWGFVVLLRDDPGAFTQTPTVAADLTYVVGTWLGQQNIDATSKLSGKVDLAHVGLAGHSRGGKASLLAAENGLKGKVTGWFGLDPIDASSGSADPQARGAVGAIGIPTVYLGATVSGACSPAADNYEVLFAASTTPSVEIKAIGAGHTELEDQASCVACGFCNPAGTADPKTVLAFAVRYTTAFFARELLGDASVGAAFEGAGASLDTAAGFVTITSK